MKKLLFLFCSLTLMFNAYSVELSSVYVTQSDEELADAIGDYQLRKCDFIGLRAKLVFIGGNTLQETRFGAEWNHGHIEDIKVYKAKCIDERRQTLPNKPKGVEAEGPSK